MPMREHVTVKVILAIEVDGHRLEFTNEASASGGRYFGQRAPESFAGAELERSIRSGADRAMQTAADKAAEFLARAYPLADDPR